MSDAILRKALEDTAQKLFTAAIEFRYQKYPKWQRDEGLTWDGIGDIDREAYRAMATAALASSSESKAAEGEVDANKYVQPVPDHCDRITWRNHYYHLPIIKRCDAAPSVPAGFKLVPIEPTREQIMAAHDGPLGAEDQITAEVETWLIEMYQAFLSAAPDTAPGGKS